MWFFFIPDSSVPNVFSPHRSGLHIEPWALDSSCHSRGLVSLQISGWLCFFLSNKLYLSGITLNSLFNAHVTLKIFTLKSGMKDVSVHITGQSLQSILRYPFHFPQNEPILVLLFLFFSTVFTSRGVFHILKTVHYM